MAILPVIEPLAGPVNGSNRVFETTTDYVPDSVRVFRNGLVGVEELTDGWVELRPRKIRMKEAPKVGDVLQAYYLRA